LEGAKKLKMLGNGTSNKNFVCGENILWRPGFDLSQRRG